MVMEGKKVAGTRFSSRDDGAPVVDEFDIKRQWKLRRGQSLFLMNTVETVHTSTGGIPANTNVRFSINGRVLLSDAGTS